MQRATQCRVRTRHLYDGSLQTSSAFASSECADCVLLIYLYTSIYLSLRLQGPNLANLIRDVRLDLDAPNLPFIVGELGMHGMHPQGNGRAISRVMLMRAQQEAVTRMREFQNNSLFVRTAPFVVENGTAYNAGYHYFGRADTYFHIGRVFGEGMLKLLLEKNAITVNA
jgi:hypothetical protein